MYMYDHTIVYASMQDVLHLIQCRNNGVLGACTTDRNSVRSVACTTPWTADTIALQLASPAAKSRRNKAMGMATPLQQEYQTLQSSLVQKGQQHLLAHWDTLSAEQQHDLLQEVQALDFTFLNRIFQASSRQHTTELKSVQPVKDVVAVADMGDDQRQQWVSQGYQLIAEGKLAVLLLAGGQGTRLGSALPKGCYDIGLPSHKSLFQLQAERILRLQTLAADFVYGPGAAVRKPLQWYIMTSSSTDANTKAHFQAHQFFGLNPSQVTFFQQGWLPGFTLDGKVILETATTVFKAPDGNGGIYMALAVGGVLQHMHEHGVEAVDCYGVDNVLVRPGDPLFAGCCWKKQAQCGARVVAKAYPEEKVGVFAVDGSGKAGVVEYSEMDPVEAASRDPTTGSLRYNWSNVCMHYFTVAFLEQVAAQLKQAGVYHIAKKTIKSVNGAVDGIKLELFIFDVFQYADRVALVEVLRDEQFAPVKNAPGSAVDSPDTARAAVLRLHSRWVEAAGGQVTSDSGVEVSPSLSYAGEGLTDVCTGKIFSAPLEPSLQGGVQR